MSDIKTDKELQLLVESIANKINRAPALNGGFDRMLVIVEHIQDKQEQTANKLDKIHDGLYEPNDGLYARVKMVETVTADFAKKQAEHLGYDEKNMKEMNESLKKLTDIDTDLGRKAETTQRLKKIAGEDLEKLEAVIRVKSLWAGVWSKAAWLLGGGILAAIGKTLWELLAHR